MTCGGCDSASDTDAESILRSPTIKSLSPACGAEGLLNCRAGSCGCPVVGASVAFGAQAASNTRTNTNDRIRLKGFILFSISLGKGRCGQHNCSSNLKRIVICEEGKERQRERRKTRK